MFKNLLFGNTPAETFWSVIDEARSGSNSTNETCNQVSLILQSRKLKEIEKFHEGFWMAFEQALSPGFTAATHLISGGNTRFKLMDLFNWLVLQGKDHFEKVMEDPEVLVDFDLETTFPEPGFLEVAFEAADKAHGEELDATPINPATLMMEMLTDGRMAAIKQMKDAAQDHFPRLAERFWDEEVEAAEAEQAASRRGNLNDQLAAKAEEGNIMACQTLGSVYYNGNGTTPSDPAKARHYFGLGAEAGDPVCQVVYGKMFIDGDGGEKAPEVGAGWIRKASDQGSPDAIFEYAILLLNGIGVDAAPDRAIELLQHADKEGQTDATVILSTFYSSGEHLEKDEEKAAEYLKRAAQAGNPRAFFTLGCNSMDAGEDRYAFASFKKGADAGDVDCLSMLGFCHMQCKGTAPDPEKAFACISEAASLGSMEAVNNLGDLYENGVGVKRDVDQARELYQQAMDHGCSIGFLSMGHLHEDGIGVPKDRDKALDLYKQAFARGCVQAEDAIKRLTSA